MTAGSAARARGGWGTGFLGLSALLHAAALAAMLSAGRDPARAAPEQPVSLVWDGKEDGAGDEADSAALPGVEAQPPATPQPDAAAPGPTAAELLPTAEPPPPEPAPAPAEAAALPPPPPPAPAVPRPAPSQHATAPTIWSPPPRPGPAGEGVPLAAGAGTAAGAVTPARPAGGAANPSPDYPRSSRARGQEGRVTLLVQVDAGGRVLDLSVLGSSGHAALDESAARTVRRWRFEPARQGGQPVFSTVTVGITFRLEGERGW